MSYVCAKEMGLSFYLLLITTDMCFLHQIKWMLELEGNYCFAYHDLVLLIIYMCQVLEEIRPYLVGAAGGSLELVTIEDPIVKIQITGPAAGVMTVRVAVTQKLREKIPAIAAVQLLS